MITATRIRKLEKVLGVNKGTATLPTVDEMMSYEKFAFITQDRKMTRQEKGRLKHYFLRKIRDEKIKTGLRDIDRESFIMLAMLNLAMHFSEDMAVGNFEKKREAILQERIRRKFL